MKQENGRAGPFIDIVQVHPVDLRKHGVRERVPGAQLCFVRQAVIRGKGARPRH